ncbi:MAG: helix-turn-helix domain-containing protein [Smithella sp.]
MKDKLKGFISKYSHTMTISMLIDLADAVGISPNELVPNTLKNKTTKEEVVPDEIKANKIFAEERKIKEPTKIIHKKVFDYNQVKRKVNYGQYLTCVDIAKKYNVKKITVWQWIREKKLPAIRIGREYRIRPQDIKDFEEARYTREEK